MNNRRNKRNKSKSLYVWHRYAGLFAALFVIFVTATGIALNHTDDLTLKKHHISSNILLDLYNVQSPKGLLRFKTGERTVSQADDMLLIGADNTLSVDATLIGIAKFNGFLIVALTNKLLLVDADNQIVETLSTIDGIPDNIGTIGIDQSNQVTILANSHAYLLNNDLTLQTIAFNHNVAWSTGEFISADEQEAMATQYKSNIISLETLMLDIHSGRIFGSYGALFFDFVGVILLFLAFTGVIIWFQQRPKNKKS